MNSNNDVIKCVFLPPVRCFDHVESDKEEALKVLEEAAEVFGAWQQYDECRAEYELNSDVLDSRFYVDEPIRALVNECADVIQATCNLLYSIGVTDMAQPMGSCEQRNRERGRIK